ncbi:MAG: phosphate signaling complex protein PhoU [Actinomycetota bacterium]
MAQEIRRHFHEELRVLERRVLEMGDATQRQIAAAIETLSGDDAEASEAVVSGDDLIDAFYLEVEQRILDLFALQTPVASDLRLLTSLLHIDLHLERVGDMAVNIAKLARLTQGFPRDPTVIQHLEEMGAVALKMLAAALDAFARRDVELCQRLPTMDDPIDRLNRGMLNQILRLADDRRLLEWGIRMHVVSRQIERVGDHAVDIGEQVAFLVTGEFREFTDASHPEIESSERQDVSSE